MRDRRGWSEIVFQVSMAIIVVELALLFIGLNLMPAGIEPSMFVGPDGAAGSGSPEKIGCPELSGLMFWGGGITTDDRRGAPCV
jgi:hypothetical protein